MQVVFLAGASVRGIPLLLIVYCVTNDSKYTLIASRSQKKNRSGFRPAAKALPGCTRHRGKSTLGYIRELVQPTSLHQFQPEPRCSRLVHLDAPRQPPEAYQYAALVTWNQIPNVSYHEWQVGCAIRWSLVALVNHRYLLSSTRVQKPGHLTP